jgi:hypothetical protein
MGQIISLSERAQPRESVEAPPGGAKILFFLGVRYSRIETDAAPQTATSEQSGDAPLEPGAESPFGGGKKRRRRARA